MDLKLLMKQAQEVQAKMKKIEEDLANTYYEGSSGGGLIKVVVSGNHKLKKLFIDESLVKVDEKEILEDLIIAAFNDAKNKIDEGSNSSIKMATNGISLPAGFKF